MTITTTGEIARVGQIAIGLRFLFDAPPGLAFFDCGGTRLMLSRPEGADEPRTSVIYYAVDDIHAAARALEARGVAFESSPHMIARLPAVDVWMAFLRDSEGNLVGLMSEVARA